MVENFDRNLDTQRRRLDAMDDAVANALSEDPVAADLPAVQVQQSYRELTDFNDVVREANSWTDIDIDAALTAEQAEALAEWRS